MEEDGILYLSETLSQLLGMPVRVYKDKDLTAFFSLVSLPKDPFILSDSFLERTERNIEYCYVDNAYYYCLLNHLPYQIVVGPFSYFGDTKSALDGMASKLGLTTAGKQSFVNAMDSISRMPLETVLKGLVSYNFVLNGEKLSIGDITINDDRQHKMSTTPLENQISNTQLTQMRNSTLEIEDTLTRYVEDGNMDAFAKWCKTAPSIRAGAMSKDYLRHEKNTFIVSATIFSRAAIRGGLEYNEALDISDEYIRRCEKCSTYIEVTNLSYQMVKEYIAKVQKVKAKNSPLETEIANYVYSHLGEQISLDDIAGHLYMSKSNLCLRFRKETGLTVSQFILEKKIDESKEMLKDRSKSISSIAFALGFSSQAHFTKVFKEFEGKTPMEYRKHNN